MFAVKFRIFSLYTHGVKKGKPNPESFHTLTLYRDPSKNESVGDTLKRAKGMIQEGTRITIVNPGPETEDERLKRYAREGLEVVASASSDAKQAGDSTMVREKTLIIDKENLALARAAVENAFKEAGVPIITAQEAPTAEAA